MIVLEPLVVTTVLYPVMDVEATVWETLTVQDVPLPAVIVVPAVTPVPEITMPIAMVPVGDEVVKVVADMEPVKVAVEPVVVPL
jgi:hypothetical protein